MSTKACNLQRKALFTARNAHFCVICHDKTIVAPTTKRFKSSSQPGWKEAEEGQAAAAEEDLAEQLNRKINMNKLSKEKKDKVRCTA
jgi:hypothetical protein